MTFGTGDFCETLRKCRALGMTLSQVQILSLLSIAPITRTELAGLTGLSGESVRKSINYLLQTGDVKCVKTREGNRIRVLVKLTEQGEKIILKAGLPTC